MSQPISEQPDNESENTPKKEFDLQEVRASMSTEAPIFRFSTDAPIFVPTATV